MPVFTFDWPLKDTHFNLSVMPFNSSKIESILKRCYKYSISLITAVPRAHTDPFSRAHSLYTVIGLCHILKKA